MSPGELDLAYDSTLDALRWITFAERLAPSVYSESTLRLMKGQERANATMASLEARKHLFPPDEDDDD